MLHSRPWSFRSLIISLSLLSTAAATFAQTPESAEPAKAPDWFATMEWRCIGPARGGRAQAVAGVPGDPNTY